MTDKNQQKPNLFNNLKLRWNHIASDWYKRRLDAQLYLFNTRKKQSLKVPADFTQKFIQTKHGKVNCYQTGTGPLVVLAHGWGGGAYQFFPLMHGLKALGFRALAFDNLGHGDSEKIPATLQQSIEITNQVLEYAKNNFQDGLYAAVGHDTGCQMIANTAPELINGLHLFLISPIFNYKQYFLRKLRNLKISHHFLKQYEQQFKWSYPQQYAQLELAKQLEQYAHNTVIAHDADDQESPIEDSKKFCATYPLSKLLVTRNRDHDRIISSESVWQALKSQLYSESISVGYNTHFAANS
jgi:pimeloyl-ACP methyl ester carboxylesterase